MIQSLLSGRDLSLWLGLVPPRDREPGYLDRLKYDRLYAGYGFTRPMDFTRHDREIVTFAASDSLLPETGRAWIRGWKFCLTRDEPLCYFAVAGSSDPPCFRSV